MRRISLPMLIAVLCLPGPSAAQGVFGQGGAASADSTAETPAPVRVDSASPRASVLGFLEATRSGDFGGAARWVARSAADRAPELARRLKAVLDASLWIDLDRVSPLASGDTEDGLPRDREDLGAIEDKEGNRIPIRLARTGSGDEARWVFSAQTVDAVDELYSTLPDHWIREHLPAALMVSGPFEVLYWQWIALLVLIPLALFIGVTLGGPTRALLRRLVAKTGNEFDDALVQASRGPVILLWSVVASRILLRWIALAAPAQAFVVEVQKAIAIVAVFWLLLRAIGVLQNAMPSAKWTETHPALRSLIPLGARIARLVVFAVGVLTVIAQFGYPLGAQKSLEHFFGSISIGVDQPYRVGDWVSVAGIEGAVEAIGLRSSRIRTIDRTVITIPNGTLAEAQSENFGERERIRFNTTIGVEYGTKAATMRLIRDEIEKLLRAHPKTWPDRVFVRFAGFGASSLDIEIFCWLETTAIDDFKEMREELLLGIMEIVEGNGAGFAFPTQTIHLKQQMEEGR
jgi:MscS family membrane protein